MLKALLIQVFYMAKKNNKQSNFLSKPLLIIGGLIIALALFIGYWYIKDNKSSTSTNLTSSQNKTSYGEYKTKQYSESDLLYGTNSKYSELIPSDDTNLAKMSCTPTYNFSGGVYDKAYVDSVQEALPTEITSYANAIKNKSTKEVGDLTACTDGEKTIVSYSQGQCGGGCSTGNIAIFKDNILEKTIDIPNTIQMPYFGCSILQLVNENDLYLKCGGGDGVAAGSLIDNLNLGTLEITTIKSCTSQGTEIKCN